MALRTSALCALAAPSLSPLMVAWMPSFIVAGSAAFVWLSRMAALPVVQPGSARAATLLNTVAVIAPYAIVRMIEMTMPAIARPRPFWLRFLAWTRPKMLRMRPISGARNARMKPAIDRPLVVFGAAVSPYTGGGTGAPGGAGSDVSGVVVMAVFHSRLISREAAEYWRVSTARRPVAHTRQISEALRCRRDNSRASAAEPGVGVLHGCRPALPWHRAGGRQP